jgi:dihydroorotase
MALQYKERIMKYNTYGGNPLMTLYLHSGIDYYDIRNITNHKDIIGLKYYPKNVTTNSQYGTENIEEIYAHLSLMEKYNIPLLIHGESNKPNIDIFNKESMFIQNELSTILRLFPRLRIVLEHISTIDAITCVLNNNNVYATITPHHLLLNRNDIFKDGLNPHLYCIPILKKIDDQYALINAAISGNNKFFLGTDNAPHLQKDKLSSCGCAGIFNSPVAIESLTELFEKYSSLHNLEKFVSTNGAQFYNLPYNNEYITLVKDEWVVPSSYGDIIPLFCNEKLAWKQLQNVV